MCRLNSLKKFTHQSRSSSFSFPSSPPPYNDNHQYCYRLSSSLFPFVLKLFSLCVSYWAFGPSFLALILIVLGAFGTKCCTNKLPRVHPSVCTYKLLNRRTAFLQNLVLGSCGISSQQIRVASKVKKE